MFPSPELSESAKAILARKDTPEWGEWQWQLAHTLTAADCGVTDCAAFPMRVTPYYAALADWTNPEDPILRQFLATPAEGIADGFSADPFGETTAAAVTPGIKQRYPDRILAMMNITCSTYCRHCTRRGLLDTARKASLDDLIEAIKARPAVREVLLSGGDPLLLPDAEVLRWVEALAVLPQIDAVRLCTRTPVVLPMRWTEALVEALATYEKVWVQTQFNHPTELTLDAVNTARRLVNHGIPVSNQSVLLRGINDDPAVMTALCAGLQRHRIRPYYIFVCDPIAGISHFRTSTQTAQELRHYLLNHLGGLACPRVVADLPTATHKTDI
ncbi:MAG: KamA family radical SAM protein [Kiritimatiellae bacterium]|nr:KamA family radical SAM protein [Kiritimatiellia bacterium]